MNLRIELTEKPTEEQRQAILKPLRAYNASKADGNVPEHFALMIRDDNDDIIGGLHGRLFYRWLYIDLLVVPEQARGQGMGSKLMQMAEDLARERECVGLWLDTFEFQAPEFYKKCGYSEIGHIADYPPGQKHYFFQKRLSN
ncbi:GNAT family N-acetyltransferase [Pseudomonas vancouverensis]|uniref:GNAT family N-acetyltransferase n=1 Tax=Pseudomonas vancouverensis TaxID=95300 RepID=A0A1H2NVG7_PSEVA|nr:GNAT family N-acetyltransferase [Pseudomonas vancouverensis]KAB0496344.1 GNAT family N-acetyltransferase [Pseudomonas vancouverensis]TDB64948.1 GNAT family N-acetyltransferase [Pseudomonas vancouverensis]SDV09121.1 Acetyltransferase (GNAT) family protein [Pseudomonas vancouverensis]